MTRRKYNVKCDECGNDFTIELFGEEKDIKELLGKCEFACKPCKKVICDEKLEAEKEAEKEGDR